MPSPRVLPHGLEPLGDLAADLRWTWSHGADHLWRALDDAAWATSQNPWHLLREVPRERLERLAADESFVGEVHRLAAAREKYLADGGWFSSAHGSRGPHGIAFFSMEFGLGEALPLYAGGLGVLAGDYLKAASDLGVPAVGVGLLYQEGYFRQTIGSDGVQHELYPYNEPSLLPIAPALASDGRSLYVELEFPGRLLHLRIWHAIVGRVRLYLLDTNDPRNSPADRGITSKLYGGDSGTRFLQEVVLGIGGWRLIDTLGLDVDVCHLNEGHPAFAILERARCFMNATNVPGKTPLSFHEALWATRAGNVFTTHTAVSSAFDRFGAGFVEEHLPYVRIYAERLGISLPEILALGRRNPDDVNESFNLAYLAIRGCATTNGVSALHGVISRRLFQDLFPRWPEHEVPITHVTNGVHTPTWDSPPVDRLWETWCGKDRWRGDQMDAGAGMTKVPDEELWACRNEARATLVDVVRHRLGRQLAFRGEQSRFVDDAKSVLDPNALTLGFARRFTEYKRPALLLRDRARLIRLLTDRDRPVQLLVAGKAHPSDELGKRAIREWVTLAQEHGLRDRLVFLEDYDMTLAHELVRGVDVWINTPRRPWEACGTSGMKVLVNGGLNLSELDGWWAEAYSATMGWAIDGRADEGVADDDASRDEREAEQLYRILEAEVVPEFYARDTRGLPVRWLARVRASMGSLAPRFSANRMVREYVDALYAPAATRHRQRTGDDARVARELALWRDGIDRAWSGVTFGAFDVRAERDGYHFSVCVDLGVIEPSMVRVELYAEPTAADAGVRTQMELVHRGDRGHGLTYSAFVATARPSSHFTPRVIPFHPEACVPAEGGLIAWQR